MPKKQEQSRWIKVTLNRDREDEVQFENTPDERAKILEVLRESSGSYAWSIIAYEQSETGLKHYHAHIRYKTPVKNPTLVKLRETFDMDILSEEDRPMKCNEVKFGNKQQADWIGYITKDGDYEVDGVPDVNVKGISERAQKKAAVKLVCESEGISERDQVLKDIEIQQWVVTFMNLKGVHVNWHTRQVRGMTHNEFFEALEEADFSKLFGDHGIKWVKSHISENIFYDLPMWKPDLDWVKFEDGYYNLSSGLFYELEDLAREEIPIPTAVREYDVPYDDTEPEFFISLLERWGWDVESFKESYGRQFKAKVRRARALLIYGDTFSGKSTICAPWLDVFKDVVGQWASDGKYSYGSIAEYPMVYTEEVNLFCPQNDINAMKKVLEGVECRVPNKHTKSVECVPKNVIATSNDTPPEPGRSKDADAIRTRLDIYHTNKPFTLAEEQVDMLLRIRDEAPKVLVWATS